MTEASARIVANAVLVAAGAAAVYFIVANPRLRRLAFRLAKVSLTTTLPAYLATEVRGAWVESGRNTRDAISESYN